ncbi:MAG: DHHA1 domain-containing protein, partial [Fervidobacterium sp.]
RRVEAITGLNSLGYLRESEEILDNLKQILEVPKSEIITKVQKLIEEKKNIEKQLLEAKRKLINPEEISRSAKLFENVRYVSAVLEGVEADIIKELVDDISDKIKGIVLLISKVDGKIIVSVKVPKELTSSYHAGNIAKNVSKVLGGGGGGNPTFAQAGGKLFDKIDEAIETFEKIIRKEV